DEARVSGSGAAEIAGRAVRARLATAVPAALLGRLCVIGTDREAGGAVRAGLAAEAAVHAARAVEAGEPAAGAARRVRVVIDEIRLVGGRCVARVRCHAGVEAARPVRRELRDRDRGEDADDGDDHQELDQGETFRLPTLHLGTFAHHVLPWGWMGVDLGREASVVPATRPLGSARGPMVADASALRVAAAGCYAERRERHECDADHSITEPSWKIGRYIEMTRPPITTPRKRITAGSSSDMRFATMLSTSSS